MRCLPYVGLQAQINKDCGSRIGEATAFFTSVHHVFASPAYVLSAYRIDPSYSACPYCALRSDHRTARHGSALARMLRCGLAPMLAADHCA